MKEERDERKGWIKIGREAEGLQRTRKGIKKNRKKYKEKMRE